jgi:methionine aminopeptidase
MSKARATAGQEGTGPAFSVAAMIHARDRTFDAVNRIAAAIRPGVTEGAAQAIAGDILDAMGMDRLWHRNVIRFGPGTLETFRGPFQPDYVLRTDDIFFVDLGVVWNGHEGDCGDTFVVGSDPDMHACAAAARQLWTDVAGRWREQGLSGTALYAFAAATAQARGWTLNHAVKGHRVSDFPHAIHGVGRLGDFAQVPSPALWILEIQIAHPTRPIGAFYEDILIGAIPDTAPDGLPHGRIARSQDEGPQQ